MLILPGCTEESDIYNKPLPENTKAADLIPTIDGYMDISGYDLPSDEIGIEVLTPTQGLKMKKQRLKAHDSKARQKPPCVLPPERFCPTTVANRYLYP